MDYLDKKPEGKIENPEVTKEQTIERLKEAPNATEILFGLGVVVAGGFAAKKAWEQNIGGVQEKTRSAVDELFGAAIQKGKNELMRALNLDVGILSGESKPKEKITESQAIDKKPDTGHKEFLKDRMSQMGVHPEALNGDINTAKPEDVIEKSFFELLSERDNRFAAIADIDPNFAAEAKKLAEESQTEIMEFVRGLDPETRGLISSAFLSSEIIPNEIKDRSNATVESFESQKELSEDDIEGMTDQEILDLHGEIADKQYALLGQTGDYYNNYFAKEQKIAYEQGISSYYKVAARSALKNYLREHPEEFEELGYHVESDEQDEESQASQFEKPQIENKEIPKTDMEIMKSEYHKLLIERGMVQKRLLTMMTEVVLSHKK